MTGAMADFDRAIILDPRNRLASFFRAKAQGRRGHYVQAIEELTRCISLDSTNAKAFDARGACKNLLGRHGEALKDFHHALHLSSTRFPRAPTSLFDDVLVVALAARPSPEVRQSFETDLQLSPKGLVIAQEEKGSTKLALAKEGWLGDNSARFCLECGKTFSFLNRKHHCRSCGCVICAECSIKNFSPVMPVKVTLLRVCKSCFAYISERTPNIVSIGDLSACLAYFSEARHNVAKASRAAGKPLVSNSPSCSSVSRPER